MYDTRDDSDYDIVSIFYMDFIVQHYGVYNSVPNPKHLCGVCMCVLKVEWQVGGIVFSHCQSIYTFLIVYKCARSVYILDALSVLLRIMFTRIVDSLVGYLDVEQSFCINS